MTYHGFEAASDEVSIAIIDAAASTTPDAYRGRPISDTDRPALPEEADRRTMDRPTQ